MKTPLPIVEPARAHGVGVGLAKNCSMSLRHAVGPLMVPGRISPVTWSTAFLAAPSNTARPLASSNRIPRFGPFIGLARAPE